MSQPQSQRELMFQAVRRRGLGGSDIAAIAGLSPYNRPIDIYQQKLGLVESEPTAPMIWGHRHEKTIINAYKEETGRLVMSASVAFALYDYAIGEALPDSDPMEFVLNTGTLVSRRGPFLANVDGFVVDNEKIIGLLEAKTASERFAYKWGDPGTENIPPEYYIQIQAYLGMTGLPWCDCAVLIGLSDFRVYRIKASSEAWDNIQIIGNAFWEYVLTQTPPPPEGTEAYKQFLSRLYPRSNDTVMKANEEIVKRANDLAAVRAKLETFEGEALEHENTIKAFMADASILEGPGFRVTWRTSKDGEVTDWKSAAAAMREHIDTLVYAGIVDKHTTTKPGSRRFLFKEI